jgi:hypothetical protein
MTAAGIAYEDGFLLDSVATLSMGGTWIDRVSVVEATADRVPFDDLVAHVERCCLTTTIMVNVRCWGGLK